MHSSPMASVLAFSDCPCPRRYSCVVGSPRFEDACRPATAIAMRPRTRRCKSDVGPRRAGSKIRRRAHSAQCAAVPLCARAPFFLASRIVEHRPVASKRRSAGRPRTASSAVSPRARAPLARHFHHCAIARPFAHAGSFGTERCSSIAPSRTLFSPLQPWSTHGLWFGK